MVGYITEKIVVVNFSFVLPVGALYVKRFFKPEAKKNVLEMVDNLREEMYRILQTVDWMDNNTRRVPQNLLMLF